MNYEDVLLIIKQKTDNLMEIIKPDSFMHEVPLTSDGKYSTKRVSLYKPENWTHSFFNGIVAYMYFHYKEEKYLNYLLEQKEIYTTLLHDNENEITHDVGFLYSLYAVALYKLTGDTDFKKLALKAADEIGKRYQFRANVVQAFYDMRVRGITDDIALIIVDDMMNMQLLMWAYSETGHSFYRSVYMNHIENSVKYLIRDDYSVRHAYHFDAKTGNPLTEMNYCGYSIGSHWARGTSWMIYGLTSALMHSASNERYLHPLVGVSDKYLSLLDESAVPVWDFRLPDNELHNVDTSAAVITASAFIQFADFDLKDNLKAKYQEVSDRALDTVCNMYIANNDCENIIIYTHDKQETIGSIWGDYFFTELLMKKIYGKDMPNFWI